jgi:Dolichyl-phosphate-mannose-protein mannosyltransferase
MNNFSHFSKWPSIKLIYILVFLFIAFGTYQRLVTPLEFNPLSSLLSDPGRHWGYAIKINEEPVTATDNIGYQLWLSVIARITTINALALGVYAGLLSAITPWIWYRFFREAVNSKLVALIGWALIACLPSWIGIYSYFMSETLFLPVFGLALWFTWRALRKNTFNSFLLSSIFWILAILTRQFAVLPAFIALARLLSLPEQRRRKISAFLILAICTFTPVACRSYQLMGVFSPLPYKPFDVIMFISGREHVNLLLKNSQKNTSCIYCFGSASTYVEPFAPLSSWHSSRRGAGDIGLSIDLAQGTKDWSIALNNSWRSWPIFFQMWGENMIFLLIGPSWPDCNPAHPGEQLQARLSFLWAPFFLLILICNSIYTIKQKRIDFLPALVMTVWFGCLLIPYITVEGRYRKPLEGLLIANTLWLISPKKRLSIN